MLTEFVERRLGARDLVLIVKPLDSLPNMRLTRDRAVILKAIAGFEGRKGDYTPRTAFERDYIAPDPERIDSVRAQIAASALTAMSQHLGGAANGPEDHHCRDRGLLETCPPPWRRRPALARRRHAIGQPIERVDLSDRSASAGSNGTRPGRSTRLIRIRPRCNPWPPRRAAKLSWRARRCRRRSSESCSDASGYYLVAFQPA